MQASKEVQTPRQMDSQRMVEHSMSGSPMTDAENVMPSRSVSLASSLWASPVKEVTFLRGVCSSLEMQAWCDCSRCE